MAVVCVGFDLFYAFTVMNNASHMSILSKTTKEGIN
jgi:hypothetical protein